jgi:hypothetical protein
MNNYIINNYKKNKINLFIKLLKFNKNYNKVNLINNLKFQIISKVINHYIHFVKNFSINNCNFHLIIIISELYNKVNNKKIKNHKQI